MNHMEPFSGADKKPLITAQEFQTLLLEEVNFLRDSNLATDRLEWGSIVLRQAVLEQHQRPGGIVAGPVLFGLADVALYGVVMSVAGPVRMATTTDMSIRFLRPAGMSKTDLLAEGRVIKAGKRLVIGEVAIRHEDEDEPVCHATGTYSVPPNREK